MSGSSDVVSERVAIRRVVRDVVAGEPVDKAQTISEVAGQVDSPEEIVREELNELEQHGFVHLAGDGDSAEVRLP
jgi:predicted transcriptional regulator